MGPIDLRGVVWLMWIGLGAAVIGVAVAPWLIGMGLAWLLEPRAGAWVWTAAHIVGGAWAGLTVVGAAFFAFVGNRL